MQLDFEIHRSTRRCAATDRALEPGEICFSVLEQHGAEIVRKDFSKEAWHGPSPEAFGWWKSHIPDASAKKIKLAPNDVLIELFDQLADQPQNEDMRYVLALLLVRRRVFRLDGPTADFSQPSSPTSVETLTVYCPKHNATYEILLSHPTSERIDQIQQQLGALLVSGGEPPDDEKQGCRETGRHGENNAA